MSADQKPADVTGTAPKDNKSGQDVTEKPAAGPREPSKRHVRHKTKEECMKVYKGIRTNGPGSAVVTVDGVPLDPCNDVRNHSPDGFEWGYGGSGPAQLALAILCDLIGEHQAVEGGLYQKFKFKLIAAIDKDQWVLSEEQVRDVLNLIKEENP